VSPPGGYDALTAAALAYDKAVVSQEALAYRDFPNAAAQDEVALVEHMKVMAATKDLKEASRRFADEHRKINEGTQ
jgi:hypothetical protein